MECEKCGKICAYCYGRESFRKKRVYLSKKLCRQHLAESNAKKSLSDVLDSLESTKHVENTVRIFGLDSFRSA